VSDLPGCKEKIYDTTELQNRAISEEETKDNGERQTVEIITMTLMSCAVEVSTAVIAQASPVPS
jgi:hypothetical protein